MTPMVLLVAFQNIFKDSFDNFLNRVVTEEFLSRKDLFRCSRDSLIWFDLKDYLSACSDGRLSSTGPEQNTP